ncbi:uncharacterized protein B0H18DRAFT_1120780 [Fomitopsis serialis]|uniref:uncharacterized protein n=1 Tax=Fomitopsis serialis TaxID=139415 RepID=UPI0020084090|nr:uncharacterized protein B0H18DRAFT_1120780 [Neoantrodia serialis]KAH9922603.1 hypothetical protein B0H18DRAFT_1120780 [Neoantrodia serialis]
MTSSTSWFTTFHVLLNTPMVPPEQKEETMDVPLQDFSSHSPRSSTDSADSVESIDFIDSPGALSYSRSPRMPPQ